MARELSEREREWRGHDNNPEFDTLLARSRAGTIRIISMAVGRTPAEWVLHYIDLEVKTLQQPTLGDAGW